MHYTVMVMSRSRFFDEMQKIALSSSTDKEKMVARVYEKGIQLYFKGTEISHPFKCDGYIESKTDKGGFVRMIIEYKDNKDFSLKVNKARVIVQVLYYVKRFELEGLRLPNVILVGDLDECFVFHMNDILSYLDCDIDWNIAPSKAADKNPDLVLDIVNDENISPFVFRVNDNFSFKEVADRIIDLANNVQRFVHVTEHNIAKIYEYFTSEVVSDLSSVSANDIVSIFIGVIKGNSDYYLHPAKRNTLVTPIGEIKVKSDGFSSFIEYFKRTYTPQEQMVFDSIADRLIEDTKRRADGEFYTPTKFVDKAHEMISSVFGEDWKENFVVWDNCCGTKNLTRDYSFKELYTSSLYQADLEIGKRYNRNSHAFVFDFLKDYIPTPEHVIGTPHKLPEGLVEALENDKPIIFFLNPPYVRNSGEGNGIGSSVSVCQTQVLETMNSHKIGACSANLYAQFIYRILLLKRAYNLTNCHIALFSPTLFLSGESWKNFRREFLKDFAFERGVTFKASYFSGCSSNWGIAFTVWRCGETHDKQNFPLTLIDVENGEIAELGEKIVYNADTSVRASDWVRQKTNRKPTYDVPNMTSAIKVQTKNTVRSGKCVIGYIGYFYCKSNNVDKNGSGVALFTSAGSDGVGLSITKENILDCTSLFAARKLLVADWINSKDEYLKPDTGNPLYAQYQFDALIYSLFNPSSNQSSLRQVPYKGKHWDIRNEFFFMAKEEIEELANIHNNDECYYDAHTDTERYVYSLLKDATLSPEAQAVLDKAVELTKASFKYRQMFNDENPDYQINNWDCGWYQIKALIKQCMPDRLTEFSSLYKALADLLRPMVYELGFLK